MVARTVDGFVAERAGVWAELDELSTRAGSGADLTAGEALRLGAAYRGTAADLALARARYAGNPVVARLEQQVAHGREAVFDGPRRGSVAPVVAFARRGWWQLVATARGELTVAAGLLGGLLLVAVAYGAADPHSAVRTLPVPLQRVPVGGGQGLAAAVGLPRGVPALSASWTPTAALVLGLLAVAGGLLGGLGTVAVLGVVALQVGVPAGLALRAGSGGRLVTLLLADGLLLLVLTVVCAAEGLRIGRAVVDPGVHPRGELLVAFARRATLVLAGALPAYAAALGLAAGVAATSATVMAPLGLLAVLLLAAGVPVLGRPERPR